MKTLINNSNKIREAMARQGRKYDWLINHLDMSRATFYKRLRTNTWTVKDIIKMETIGLL